MPFLRKILAERPVRTPLEFGINENVRLISISNEKRMREGEVIKKNTHMTFAKFNSKNEVIATSEFSYMNLNPGADYTFDNFVDQVAQMSAIVKTINPESEPIDPTEGFTSLEEIKEALSSKKGCDKFIEDMYSQFEKSLEDCIGNESPLLRIKVVTDSKTGKWLQLPKEPNILERMEQENTNLHITAYELKNKNKAMEPTVITPDTKGDAPDVAVKKKSALKGL
jgi:hypothetical protein